jgi:phosphoglycolate phosphatase
MDGTLIDSSKIISNSINYVRGKLGLPQMEREKILRAVNDIDTHSPSYFYNEREFRDEHIRWFQEYYSKNHHNEVRLYDGVRELLDELKGDFTLSLATNAYRVSAMQILSCVGIEEYFKHIKCADDVRFSKPHPHMVKELLKEADVESDEAILVGDSPKDYEAAKGAGVEAIMVDWGFSEIDGAIKDIRELRDLLRSR